MTISFTFFRWGGHSCPPSSCLSVFPSPVARRSTFSPAARNVSLKITRKTSQNFHFYSPSATPTRNLRFIPHLPLPPSPAPPICIPTTPRPAQQKRSDPPIAPRPGLVSSL